MTDTLNLLVVEGWLPSSELRFVTYICLDSRLFFDLNSSSLKWRFASFCYTAIGRVKVNIRMIWFFEDSSTFNHSIVGGIDPTNSLNAKNTSHQRTKCKNLYQGGIRAHLKYHAWSHVLHISILLKEFRNDFSSSVRCLCEIEDVDRKNPSTSKYEGSRCRSSWTLGVPITNTEVVKRVLRSATSAL